MIGAALLLFGCADPASGPAQVDELPVVELDPPENGFQIMTDGMWIQPGESIVHCEVFRLDGDINDFYEIKTVEMKATQWVHHVSMHLIPPEGLENLSAHADPAEINYWPLEIEIPTGPIQCGWDVGNVFDHVKIPLLNSQSSEVYAEFPDETAFLLRGGEYLVVEYHFTNPTTEPIPARVAGNFHLSEKSAEHYLSSFFFTYNNIDVPAHTKKSHAAECFFPDDFVLWRFWRHTHEFATGFHVWHVGGEKDGEHVWSSYDWDESLFVFPEGPIVVKKGTGLRFQCDYNNTLDKTLVLGRDFGQEMCIVLGAIWTTDPDNNPPEPISCIGYKVAVEEMSNP
jgi:hypothetical protein